MSNSVLDIVKRIKQEARVRRLRKAIRLIESEGLSVVSLREIDGKAYIRSKSGNWIRVGRK